MAVVTRSRPGALLIAVAALSVMLLLPSVVHADGGGELSSSSSALHYCVSLIVGVYTWVASSQKADREKVQALETKVATMEERLKHIPTEAEGRAMLVSMSTQQTKLEALIEELKAMSERFSRYEEHMIARNQ